MHGGTGQRIYSSAVSYPMIGIEPVANASMFSIIILSSRGNVNILILLLSPRRTCVRYCHQTQAGTAPQPPAGGLQNPRWGRRACSAGSSPSLCAARLPAQRSAIAALTLTDVGRRRGGERERERERVKCLFCLVSLPLDLDCSSQARYSGSSDTGDLPRQQCGLVP